MNQRMIGNEKNIVFYSDEEGNIKIEVILQDENVWLNVKALSELFSVDRTSKLENRIIEITGFDFNRKYLPTEEELSSNEIPSVLKLK